jgi:hypothetical protein
MSPEVLSLEAKLAHSHQQVVRLTNVCRQALLAMQLIDDPDLIAVENALRATLAGVNGKPNDHAARLQEAYLLAWSALPDETHDRLARALDLALAGAVKLTTEGAQIRSQSNGRTYSINGQPCNCPDDRAPLVNGVKCCKHQLATWLELKAQALEQAVAA